MICARCGKEFDDSMNELNLETYHGNSAVVSCPHCGKAYIYTIAYRFYKEEICDSVLESSNQTEDDWGVPIVSDEEYNNGKKDLDM